MLNKRAINLLHRYRRAIVVGLIITTVVFAGILVVVLTPGVTNENKVDATSSPAPKQLATTSIPESSALETVVLEAPREKQLTIEPEEIMKPWAGDLNAMVERKIIRVLTVYSKTFYFVDKGVQRGIVYDTFRQFEENLNKKLIQQGKLKKKDIKVHVVFIPVNRGDILQALASGRGDIAVASLTITPERQKIVDFSAPVYRGVNEVLVSGTASPAVSNLDDLSGKEVMVRKSSSYYESLIALNKRFAAENKPPVIIMAAAENLEDEDLIEMVNAGLIPLTVVDKPIADFWNQVFPNITVHADIILRQEGDIAWAIRQNNPELKAALNDFQVHYSKGTSVGNIILSRYLKNADYVKDAASEAERKKFFELLQYFQKYGSQYDVDWLLMAAQGYQESRLNNAVRSPVGAIGIMQIMPATGKELGVGDITQVEPNIHAGVKYMRWMIDEYYAKEPMTQLDKALFAFASYNAGAGRISQMRKEAAKRGLDPNVWFHNVELVVADKIGAETTTYVANIYKYYIAYHMILEARNNKEQDKMKIKTNKTN